MRKVSASVLVLIALLAVIGSAMSALAKSADTNSSQGNLAYVHVKLMNSKGTANANSTGFTASQLRKAYGIDALGTNEGAGITVAIIDACGNSHAQSDLDHYDSVYHLPATTIKVVKPQGTTCSAPSSWGLETDLDIQMVHAMAPKASIVLEATKNSSFTDLLNAAKDAYTKQGATVVSMSFGGTEFSGEKGAGGDGILSAGNAKGVSFTASSGDSGCGPQYPAASPFVTSVGGTTLKIKSNGTYVSETAWRSSGGGLSIFENRPAYQNGFNNNARRGIPDVALVAFGVSMYDSDFGGFVEVEGTSIGAPMWAGVLALANSKRSSSMKNADIELYAIASNSSKYANDYHDITVGSSGGNCNAHTGYDLVTGLGTPKANNLVPDLIAAKL